MVETVLSLSDRRLYLCVGARDDMSTFLPAALRGGVDVVQLREKELDRSVQAPLARLMGVICRDFEVPFVVNDSPELAYDVRADGVHVGQDDVPATEARATIGDHALVGLSTHASGELAAAVGGEGPGGPAPVDYLSAGPVVATPTKPGRPGTGPGYVELAVRQSPWPVWVTGGVGPDTVGDLVATGARHFVVVRWLVTADDPRGAARRLRGRIDELLADRAD